MREPRLSKRALISGLPSTSRKALCKRITTSPGVPRGTNMPFHS